MRRGRIGTMIGVAGMAALTIALASYPAVAQTKLKRPLTFPLKVTKSGSYVMTDNFIVGATTVPCIKVSVNDVTINMMGFSILGPGKGTGIGIDASSATDVTIENGAVTGMGGSGVVVGANGVVRDVRSYGNGAGSGGGSGIACAGSGCLVISSIANGNTKGNGLNFFDTSDGYQEDVIFGNMGTVSSGTNMGNNVCGTILCP